MHTGSCWLLHMLARSGGYISTFCSVWSFLHSLVPWNTIGNSLVALGWHCTDKNRQHQKDIRGGKKITAWNKHWMWHWWAIIGNCNSISSNVMLWYNSCTSPIPPVPLSHRGLYLTQTTKLQKRWESWLIGEYIQQQYLRRLKYIKGKITKHSLVWIESKTPHETLANSHKLYVHVHWFKVNSFLCVEHKKGCDAVELVLWINTLYKYIWSHSSRQPAQHFNGTSYTTQSM